ncbi:unnamed protein product [Diamesa serratosioi]
MKCCSMTAKKFWLIGSSTFILLFALVLAVIWPTLSLNLLYEQLKLKDGSINYENWVKTPIPMYLEIYLFNWTNPDDIRDPLVKPDFAEMGPYIFSEVHERTNMTWNPNNTITFYQKRTWQFVPEKSSGSLDDNVTNVNPIALTVAYATRHFGVVIKGLLNIMMNNKRAPLSVTKTVRELLFEGYDDGLLTIVRAYNNTDIPKPPFEKFGWFVDRNESEIYDGQFTMFTGVDDIKKLGVLQLWNGEAKSPNFRGKCSEVRGTTGELWPPIPEGTKPDISVFATDVCRTVTLKYHEDYEKFGIKGYKWIGDESVLDNGVKYPEMACYCSADLSECPDLRPGVFNASSCKFGAPAMVSFPHFYLADPSYRAAVTGMKPNREEHEFSIAMEPRTGIPLKINAQLQINLLMEPIEGYNVVKGVPRTVMPMFWFRQTAELTEELAGQAKWALLLPDIGMYTAYGFAGIGVVIVALSIFLIFFKWRRTEDTENLLS